MKQLLISLIILSLMPSFGFAQRRYINVTQGLNLNVDDEFEYRISSHTDETESNNLNQTGISESYTMGCYKFKVKEVNEDSYKLICDFSQTNDYARKRSLNTSQWQTTKSNNRELHNEKTPDYHLLDVKLEVIVAKDGKLNKIKILEYTEVKTEPKRKENLLSRHRAQLSKYFFKIPALLGANQNPPENTAPLKANETAYVVDSINENNTYLSYSKNTTQTLVETTTDRYQKNTVRYKGNRKEIGHIIINTKKGYIQELISTTRVELKADDAQHSKRIANVTSRGVTISNNTSPFTCQYIDDGNKSEATFNSTNVTIRGKIKHPDSHREVAIAWTKTEPSASKKMGIMVPLKKDNTFEIKLQVDKIRLITLVHKERSEFYIMPGDDLFIEIDTQAFDESIQASGVGAAHANLCFAKNLFENQNKCSNSVLGIRLHWKMRTTASAAYESFALTMLKLKQDYLQSAKGMQSPEVFLALYWENKLQIVNSLREYLSNANRFRKQDGLKPFDIDKYNDAPLDSLIHADNDLMAFAPSYDHFIRHYVLYYLKNQTARDYGRGLNISVKNYMDDLYPKEYNYAHIFFTGKTQESLKYSSVNDAMKQASWQVYEELLMQYKEDYPHSKRLDILESNYHKSKQTIPLSPAYDFELQDLNGNTHRLSDYKGKAVYINFWSLGCGTDGALQKNQNKLQEACKDRNIVFIHILFGGDKAKAESYIAEHQQKGVFLIARGQTETLLKREYFFSAVPHYCLIDINGNIVISKNNAPYQILRAPDILDDAFSPTRLSVNYQQRSKLMTFISLTLLCVLLIGFIYFVWNRQRQARQLKLTSLNHQLRESELKAIRAQMNPHFIHNCLNSIQNLVQKKESDKAHLYISKFSSLIRDTLTLSNKQEISLSQEIEMVTNYITLENLRFAITFELSIAPDVDIYSIFIPPMLLQPIIENAILHGLAPLDEEKKLSLKVYKDQQIVCIEIKDNGIGRVASLTKQTGGTGKGTRYTNERLQLLSQKHGTFCEMTTSDLSDHNKQACGTLVEIKIEDED